MNKTADEVNCSNIVLPVLPIDKVNQNFHNTKACAAYVEFDPHLYHKFDLSDLYPLPTWEQKQCQ